MTPEETRRPLEEDACELAGTRRRGGTCELLQKTSKYQKGGVTQLASGASFEAAGYVLETPYVLFIPLVLLLFPRKGSSSLPPPSPHQHQRHSLLLQRFSS